MADDEWAAFNPQSLMLRPLPPAPAPQAEAPAAAPPKVKATDEFAAFAPQVDYEGLNSLPEAFKQRLGFGKTIMEDKSWTGKIGDSASAIWNAVKEGNAKSGIDGMYQTWDKWEKDIAGIKDPIARSVAEGAVPFAKGINSYFQAITMAAPSIALNVAGEISGQVMGQTEEDKKETREGFRYHGMGVMETMALMEGGGGITGLGAGKPAIITKESDFARLTRNVETGKVEAQTVGRMPLPEDFKAVAAELGGGSKVEHKLMEVWKENGVHPLEVLEGARSDAFAAHDLGAAATHSDPPLVSPQQQPLSMPSRLAGDLKVLGEKAIDAKNYVQELIAPISKASDPAIRYTMEVQGKRRRVDWDRDRAFLDIDKRFDLETQKDVFRRMDEENAIQMGVADRAEYPGLAALQPEARAWAEEWTGRAIQIRAMMLDREMVSGDGMKVYMPYLYEGIEKGARTVGAPGYSFKDSTGTMRQRKYMTPGESEAAAKIKLGPKATLVENMKALPQALAEQEKAIHMHDYLESIKKFGQDIGERMLLSADEHAKLNNPADKADYVLFNVGDLAQWKYIGETATGERLMVKGAIAIKKEWAPAIQAIIDTKFNGWDKLVQNVKNRPMALIMNSPFSHLSVVYGKALPKDPGMMMSFRWVNEGRSLVADKEFMRGITEGGYVWWGRKGGGAFEDALHGNPADVNFKPGRSWTADSLGYVADVLFGEEAGIKTRMTVDKLGVIVHDRMLGNSVNYIGLSIAKKRLDYMTAKYPDIDRRTLMVDAAHFGNRFAGSIAPEAVSALSRGVADSIFFSRKFTFGNIGIAKDAAIGAPKYVNAVIREQLKEHYGPAAETMFKSIKSEQQAAMFKALIYDFVLMYGVNAVAQIGVNSAVTYMTGRPPDEADFWTRWQDAINKVHEHPFNPLSYVTFLPSLSPAYNREPGKDNRILLGHRPDGTAIYARISGSRMGEDYLGLVEHPGKWLQNKLSPPMKSLMELYQNQDSFGRYIYTPGSNPISMEGAGAAVAIATHIAKSNLPMAQIDGGLALVAGTGDAKDALAAFGPYLPPPLTVTASQGFPGGPKAGVVADVKRTLDFQKDMAMSGIMKDIREGRYGEAQQRMDELGIEKGLQRYYMRVGPNPALRMSPKAMRKFYQHSTPEEQRLFDRVR